MNVNNQSESMGHQVSEGTAEHTGNSKERRNLARNSIRQYGSGQNSVYSGDPPRSLAQLASFPVLLSRDITKRTRDEAELLSCEYYEHNNKFPVFTGKGQSKSCERLFMKCSCDLMDCGLVGWVYCSRGSEEPFWKCTKFTPFKCIGATEPSKQTGFTVYAINMLKPIIIQNLDKAKIQSLTVNMCRNLLLSYCARKLSTSFVQRLRKSIQQDVFGTPSQSIKKLPCVAQALSDKGWVVQIIVVSSGEMYNELVNIHRAEFDKVEQSKPVTERALYDPSVVPSLPDDNIYVVGFLLCPPNAEHLHQYCHRFSVSDFTHCKHRELKGILGSRYMLNGNRSLVDIAHVRLLRNEDEISWRILNQATCLSVRNFDSSNHIDASDADKGAHSAYRRHFPHSGRFLDYYHRVQALQKTGARSLSVQHFKKAFQCKTVEELQRCKSEMPQNVRSIIEKYPDEEQFPVCAKYLRGQMGSSAVESANHALLAVREMDFTSSMMGLAENIKRRHDKQVLFSKASKGTMTPSFTKKFHEVKVNSRRFGSDSVTFSADKSEAFVKSIRLPGKVYKVVFREIREASSLACDGNCSVLTGIPCEHQVAAVRHLGKDIEDYLHEFDTVSNWREMYTGSEIELPSSADIESYSHLVNEKFSLPPVLKPAKGRPKKGARQLGWLERMSKST